MRVRPAERGDLLAVVDVFWRCWTQTYAERLPAGLQGAMDLDRAAALWATALADADGTVLVAESERPGSDGGVLGVVRFVRAPDGQGLVASLYVAPEAQGGGVGRELLTAAEVALAADGASSARLWVFAANDDAREFYRRRGWRPSGQRRVDDAFGEPELGMTKALGTGARPGGRTTHDTAHDDDPPDQRQEPRDGAGGAAARGGARHGYTRGG